jgi:hypothetical protein
MPWPNFSELSFGFSFLREFERQHAPNGNFPAAPDFISQNTEAELGYDVEVALDRSAPVFFQFKRSFVLTTHNATEIRNGNFKHPTLFRMLLHKNNNYQQHRALRKLENQGNSVFYVTSQIETHDQLTAAYLAGNVLEEVAALFSPAEIRLRGRGQSHHLSFRANDNFAYIFSPEGRRFQRNYPSWDAVRTLLDARKASISSNRAKLNAISDSLARDNPDAAELANRFQHPAFKASILAFLTLDLQLTGHKWLRPVIPLSFCLGLPVAEDIHHAVCKFVDIEGFPQPRRHLERARISHTAAVTGDKKERHRTADELIGDRRGILAPQITVQQNAIEIVLAYCRNSLSHIGRYSDDFASKLLQHLLDQHGDKNLVLHNEDT